MTVTTVIKIVVCAFAGSFIGGAAAKAEKEDYKGSIIFICIACLSILARAILA